VVAGGTLVARTDLEHQRLALGPWLLAGTTLGIYATIPETDAVRVIVGAALPFMLLPLVWRWAVLGTGGAAATVTLCMLVAARDGAARPGAVVGAVGSLGLLALAPFAAATATVLGPRVDALPKLRDRYAALAYALVLHGVLVLWASRVAGLRRDAPSAALLLVPAVVVGVVAAIPLLSARVGANVSEAAPSTPPPARPTWR
jgi:hypothetical protein